MRGKAVAETRQRFKKCYFSPIRTPGKWCGAVQARGLQHFGKRRTDGKVHVSPHRYPRVKQIHPLSIPPGSHAACPLSPRDQPSRLPRRICQDSELPGSCCCGRKPFPGQQSQAAFWLASIDEFKIKTPRSAARWLSAGCFPCSLSAILFRVKGVSEATALRFFAVVVGRIRRTCRKGVRWRKSVKLFLVWWEAFIACLLVHPSRRLFKTELFKRDFLGKAMHFHCIKRFVKLLGKSISDCVLYYCIELAETRIRVWNVASFNMPCWYLCLLQSYY